MNRSGPDSRPAQGLEGTIRGGLPRLEILSCGSGGGRRAGIGHGASRSRRLGAGHCHKGSACISKPATIAQGEYCPRPDNIPVTSHGPTKAPRSSRTCEGHVAWNRWSHVRQTRKATAAGPALPSMKRRGGRGREARWCRRCPRALLPPHSLASLGPVLSAWLCGSACQSPPAAAQSWLSAFCKGSVSAHRSNEFLWHGH